VGEQQSWEATALNWCPTLHNALRAHPHFTELVADRGRAVILEKMGALVGVALREGGLFR
jgi:hypothetical protein